MRMASTVHHTNPRSATLDFWRKTTSVEDYKIIQAKRRAQMNKPTRYVNKTIHFSLKITLSSGLNKEDHIIIAQVGFHDAIGRSWQINRGSVLWNMTSSTNHFENYWKRLGEMEKRRVGTRFIDREATEEDQAKPLMQVLAEKGITCSIMWHKLFRHHRTVAPILRDGWWQTLFGAKFEINLYFSQ